MIEQAVNSMSSLAKYLQSSQDWVRSNFGAVEWPCMGIVGVVVTINACEVGVKICVIEGKGFRNVGGQSGDEVNDSLGRDGSIEGGVIGKGNKS